MSFALGRDDLFFFSGMSIVATDALWQPQDKLLLHMKLS